MERTPAKTRFAKALIDLIPQQERLRLIEDTAELKIDRPNVFRFEARKEQIDSSGTKIIPAVTIRDLVKATLRHRPDRLIIGEVRGGEAFDLLDALNTGHAGSISTVHANSALQALSRLATLSLRADVDIPYRTMQGEIGDLIDLIVYVERRDGQRRLAEVLEAIQGCGGQMDPRKQTGICESDTDSRADYMADIRKGDHVFIEGELVYREYERTIETDSGPVKVMWPLTEIIVESASVMNRKDKEERKGAA